jgi:hypothetical protein
MIFTKKKLHVWIYFFYMRLDLEKSLSRRYEQIMNKLRTNYEQITNKLRTNYEQKIK